MGYKLSISCTIKIKSEFEDLLSLFLFFNCENEAIKLLVLIIGDGSIVFSYVFYSR
ncbi:MAG: hypothetical protein ACI9P5_000890 [Saprospiraceae bacterium]|jgi:hypothetical protein